MKNKISELNELCQKLFGESIVTRVIKKEGPDHAPTISVEIELPMNHSPIFIGTGRNQKIAKQSAAEQALEYIKREDYE